MLPPPVPSAASQRDWSQTRYAASSRQLFGIPRSAERLQPAENYDKKEKRLSESSCRRSESHGRGGKKKEGKKKTVAGGAVNLVQAESLVSCAATAPLEAEQRLVFLTFFFLFFLDK